MPAIIVDKADALADNAFMFEREKVAGLIKARGRTREWVAAQCRVEPTTLNSYLCGARDPSRAVVALMAIALEVPESEFWQNKAKPKPAA